MPDTNILITGGAGYIGSHVCKALARAGYVPVTADSLVHGHRRAVKWGPLLEGDILDRAFLDAAFDKYRPRAVIHFAAYTYVGESMSDPGKYYENNVGGTVSLLQAMRRHDCSTIVFSSTCAVYGIPESTPISEDHPRRPVNPYGRSKLMIEDIIRDYGRAYGLKYALLRYFNAAGADPEGDLGEDHDPETHLIPLAVKCAMGESPFIEVYGEDYPTPDGTAVRDYVHVTDLARAHVATMRSLDESGDNLELNLGIGRGHSVREVLQAVRQVVGRDFEVRPAARRPGDVSVLTADPAKARSVLDWRPQIIDIRDMVESAWRWYRRSFKP